MTEAESEERKQGMRLMSGSIRHSTFTTMGVSRASVVIVGGNVRNADDLL